MKAWITKYALSSGIQEMEGTFDDTHFTKKHQNGDWCSQYFYGKDWHTTREAAVARAEEMRAKKIVSLEKSIKKMKSLKF